MSEKLAFDQFFKLPDELLHAAAKVMKLSNRYIILDEAQHIAGLNWDGFRDAIAGHPPPGLAFVKLESTSITIHTGSVDDMVGKIVRFLYDTFSLRGMDNDGLRAQIRAAFQYVSRAESDGLFSTSTYDAHGTSWEYRIVFALAHPDDADFFYSVVTTIKPTADIYEHHGFLGIGSESRHNFSADITGMELFVNKIHEHSA